MAKETACRTVSYPAEEFPPDLAILHRAKGPAVCVAQEWKECLEVNQDKLNRKDRKTNRNYFYRIRVRIMDIHKVG